MLILEQVLPAMLLLFLVCEKTVRVAVIYPPVFQDRMSHEAVSNGLRLSQSLQFHLLSCQIATLFFTPCEPLPSAAKEAKPPSHKVVITGITHTTDPDYIKEELQSEGFTPTSISPLTLKNRLPASSLLVKFRRVSSFANIYYFTSLG